MSEPTHKRLKVLLCCYACDPGYGSEPGMGWNFAYNIAQFHDVHVLVETKFKKNLLQYATENPEHVRNITFHFIQKKRNRTLRKIWPPSYYWFYREWHKKAYHYAVELDKKENFDLVHQITIASFRVPGLLWKLNKPFIWGPVGGLNQTDRKLLSGMGAYVTVFYTMRNLINLYQKKWGAAARIVAKKAHTIFACDPSSKQEIDSYWGINSIVLREVSLPSIDNFKKSHHSPDTPLDVCWAAVHEPRKALPLLLKARALCKRKIRLHIFGDGPCSKKWKEMSYKLGIDSDCIFYGKLPREQVLQKMSVCHIFCITSISEGGTTTTVAEAMGMGLPLLALDHCAYGSAIDESCGIKIKITDAKQIVSDLASNLDLLAKDELLRNKLSEGAKKRSSIFSWILKMETINKAYLNAAKSANCQNE